MKFKIGDLVLILLALALTIGGFIYIYFPRHYDSTYVARVSLADETILDIDFLNLTEDIKSEEIIIDIKHDKIKHEKEYIVSSTLNKVRIYASTSGVYAIEENVNQEDFIKSDIISKPSDNPIFFTSSLISITIVNKEVKLNYIARVEFNKEIVMDIDFNNLTEEIINNEVVIKIDYDKTKQEKNYTLKGRISNIVICASRNGVYVKESGCPDKVCINTGLINTPGRPIACIPNRILISIINSEEALG